MTDEELKAELRQEYLALGHAMQTGVATEMQLAQNNGQRYPDVEPKDLRAGVNSALVDSSSLARLLIKKGIITELEYFRAMRDGMREEVKDYEESLSKATGAAVKLS